MTVEEYFKAECYIIDIIVDGLYERAKCRNQKELIVDTSTLFDYCKKHSYIECKSFSMFIQMLKYNNYDLSLNEHIFKIKIY